MSIKQIAPYLSYVPASEEPLSAEAFIISGEKRVCIFDVGSSDEAFCELSSLSGEKVIILSHFHKDHTENIKRLAYESLYVGSRTFQKIQTGTKIQDEMLIEDGIKILVKRCPSPHEKGSLILTVNGEYTLLGDLCYAREVFNRAVALDMISVLKKLDTKYFIESHTNGVLIGKDELIARLEERFF